MKRVSKDRARQFGYMLEDSQTPLTLDHIAVKAENDDLLYAMPFGCVIAPNGDIWVLNKYAVHGVIAALLCPEQAESFGAPQPTGSRDDLPVMAYQEFELECGYRMPLIRISTRFDFNISHGRGEFWPTALQDAALRRVLNANDLLDGKIKAEVGYEHTGRNYLTLLNDGDPEPDFVARRDGLAVSDMEKDPDEYLLNEPVTPGFNDLV